MIRSRAPRRVCLNRHSHGTRPGVPRRIGAFTLLESCIALAIFAAGAIALYGLLDTNLFALGRANDVSRQSLVVRNAVEHLSAINPMLQPKGHLGFGTAQVEWKSTLVEPVRPGQAQSGGMGDFDLGLYEVEFTVTEEGRTLGTWQMRVAGYKKVRGFLFEFDP